MALFAQKLMWDQKESLQLKIKPRYLQVVLRSNISSLIEVRSKGGGLNFII